MDRREFLTGVAAAACVAATLPGARAEDKPAADAVDAAALDALVGTAQACQKAAEECLRHCANSFAKGETHMAACNQTVLNMLSICQGTLRLMVQRSAKPARLKAAAALCSDLCSDCAEACRVHAEHHAECKACMDACTECAKACDKVAGR